MTGASSEVSRRSEILGIPSARVFKSDELPSTLISDLLVAAQKTASWCNTQPWSVHILSGDARGKVSDALVSSARAGLKSESDIAFPERYIGEYKERRKVCGLQLYSAVGIERGDDAATQEGIYNKAVELHNDWRGYNNIACMHLANGDLSETIVYLNKAEALGANQADISINKGIVAARKGELAKAQKLFNQANASELNQATLDIRQGEYKKAARFFKNETSHNAALAQILDGKNGACNDGTADCHYLNAIAAARSGNNDAAISNLTNAIAANANYKAEATIDLEFVNLRANEAFIALT